MQDLEVYAAFAEIFGAVTILVGALFAIVQLLEYRRRRKYQVATELCRGFSEPELGRAVTLLRRLPDDVSLAELQSMDREYEASAQIVAMAFETMGLLVHRNIASFQLIQELTGGLLLMQWRKIHVWVEETRQEQQNPRFAEWMQWLVERMEEREPSMIPAYIAHKIWRAAA